MLHYGHRSRVSFIKLLEILGMVSFFFSEVWLYAYEYVDTNCVTWIIKNVVKKSLSEFSISESQKHSHDWNCTLHRRFSTLFHFIYCSKTSDLQSPYKRNSICLILRIFSISKLNSASAYNISRKCALSIQRPRTEWTPLVLGNTTVSFDGSE